MREQLHNYLGTSHLQTFHQSCCSCHWRLQSSGDEEETEACYRSGTSQLQEVGGGHSTEATSIYEKESCREIRISTAPTTRYQ